MTKVYNAKDPGDKRFVKEANEIHVLMKEAFRIYVSNKLGEELINADRKRINSLKREWNRLKRTIDREIKRYGDERNVYNPKFIPTDVVTSMNEIAQVLRTR